jgi:chromosome segregation ATPase
VDTRSDLADHRVPEDLSLLREQLEAADRLLGETARRLRLLSAQMDDLARSQEAVRARMDHAQRAGTRR